MFMSSLAKESTYTKEFSPLQPLPLKPLSDRPLVSVLISNYNYGAYLADAIESVLRQTYENWELIICDDGSTDCSSKILEWYKSRDSRIKIIYQANGGQSLALNAAFCKSAGDIICLLDADDVFIADKVRLVVSALTGAPDSGFAAHKMLLVDKGRNYLAEIPSLYEVPCGWYGSLLKCGGPRVLPGLPPTSGLSLRRCAAEAIFPLPAALKAHSDTLIQVVAPLVTPIVAIDAPLSEYRVHGSNIAGVSRFTESQLRNIVLYEREIWSAWRRYVISAVSGVQQDFPIPEEMAQSLMEYAYRRFRSEANLKGAHRAIPAASLKCLPWHLQLYWRVCVLFPGWLFRTSFSFVYGQPRSKIIARRILSVCREYFWSWKRTNKGKAQRPGIARHAGSAKAPSGI